jgi:NADP-dependent 3-hydroxy acid dehydrogenase YdfG
MSGLKGRIALVTSARRPPLLAFALASRGATVVVAMKAEDRAEDWAQRIRHGTGNCAVHPLAIDLASPCSVRQAALDFIARYHRLHLLVTDTTARLGPVLLANLLLDTMKQSGGGRVIRLPMPGHRQQVWSASVLPLA